MSICRTQTDGRGKTPLANVGRASNMASRWSVTPSTQWHRFRYAATPWAGGWRAKVRLSRVIPSKSSHLSHIFKISQNTTCLHPLGVNFIHDYVGSLCRSAMSKEFFLKIFLKQESSPSRLFTQNHQHLIVTKTKLECVLMLTSVSHENKRKTKIEIPTAQNQDERKNLI